MTCWDFQPGRLTIASISTWISGRNSDATPSRADAGGLSLLPKNWSLAALMSGKPVFAEADDVDDDAYEISGGGVEILQSGAEAGEYPSELFFESIWRFAVCGYRKMTGEICDSAVFDDHCLGYSGDSVVSSNMSESCGRRIGYRCMGHLSS